MHTTHLFERLILLVERSPDIGVAFEYELTPMPASLFKDSFMWKPCKATLGRILRAKAGEGAAAESSQQYVVDGGLLLHRVQWPKQMTYQDLINSYRTYVSRHFPGNVTVVFDGYQLLVIHAGASIPIQVGRNLRPNWGEDKFLQSKCI